MLVSLSRAAMIKSSPLMSQVLSEAMLSLPQETKRRYGIEYNMPVGIELKMGKNWLDLEEVSL